MFDFLKGKKTYIVAIVAAAMGIAQAFGYVIPSEVYAVLGALGLYTTRLAIADAAG